MCGGEGPGYDTQIMHFVFLTISLQIWRFKSKRTHHVPSYHHHLIQIQRLNMQLHGRPSKASNTGSSTAPGFCLFGPNIFQITPPLVYFCYLAHFICLFFLLFLITFYLIIKLDKNHKKIKF